MAVAVMIKPKKKQLVVGEMDLDKAVASPAQMEAEAKENELAETKKREKYRAAAMKALSIAKGK